VGNLAKGETVVGVGNYSGGKTSDILVENGSGQVTDWQMSNGSLSKELPIAGATSDWKVLG
jgi:hypothetical protein